VNERRTDAFEGIEELDMAALDKTSRDTSPNKDFAEPSKRGYPIEDKAHARNAKVRESGAEKADQISKAEQGEIDRKAEVVLNDH
jgi:hypothetical protein